ncbi:MAG: response regulator transcription factor [Lachnospiraceae bacterium]|nr:response regulator transcription factor [Lachnospiraceae bacterium]
MNRILVVDDEKLIVKGIKYSLEQDEMEVDVAYDGEEAVMRATSCEYDLILLDLMLPKLNGLEVCSKIRETSNVPIIMLTAKGDDRDKIEGLECGADDYITKPFNILEVKARIKAILRRVPAKQELSRIEIDGLSMDRVNKSVKINGNAVNLTDKEFRILELLLTHPEQVYSREDLLKNVWKKYTPEDIRTVDVHVRRLREKIEPGNGVTKYVFTKWGAGYYYKA